MTCFSRRSSYTHESRADALYCLHTQAIRSLMACEKQMPPSASLVFLCAHYIISYFSVNKSVLEKSLFLCYDYPDTIWNKIKTAWKRKV